MTTSTESPLFVVPTDRSSGELLRRCLDAFERITAPGELGLGAFGAHMLTILKRINETSSRQDDERLRQKVRDGISNILASHLREVDKATWCDVAPTNPIHLRSLVTLFPNGHFICLHRTCRDAAYASYRASRLGAARGLRRYIARHPGNFPRAAVENWCDKTEQLMGFEASNRSRAVRARFEDLVAQPLVEFDKLMAFAGIEWRPSMLESTSRVLRPVGAEATDNAFEREIGLGRLLPIEMLTHSLARRANSLLRELGYQELPVFPGDDDGANHAEFYRD